MMAMTPLSTDMIFYEPLYIRMGVFIWLSRSPMAHGNLYAHISSAHSRSLLTCKKTPHWFERGKWSVLFTEKEFNNFQKVTIHSSLFCKWAVCSVRAWGRPAVSGWVTRSFTTQPFSREGKERVCLCVCSLTCVMALTLHRKQFN